MGVRELGNEKYDLIDVEICSSSSSMVIKSIGREVTRLVAKCFGMLWTAARRPRASFLDRRTIPSLSTYPAGGEKLDGLVDDLSGPPPASRSKYRRLYTVVGVVDSHIQRAVLATEETPVTQRVSHRPLKCYLIVGHSRCG